MSGVIAGLNGFHVFVMPLLADSMIPSIGSWLADASISTAMQAAYSHNTSQNSFAGTHRLPPAPDPAGFWDPAEEPEHPWDPGEGGGEGGGEGE